MANQGAFGAQLTESWKQIRRNRKLPNFMVILILIGLVFLVPCLVWGLVEARAHSGGGAPPRRGGSAEYPSGAPGCGSP